MFYCYKSFTVTLKGFIKSSQVALKLVLHLQDTALSLGHLVAFKLEFYFPQLEPAFRVSFGEAFV